MAILAWLSFGVAAFYAMGDPPPGPAEAALRVALHATVERIVLVTLGIALIAVIFGAYGFSASRWIGGVAVAAGILPLSVAAALMAARAAHPRMAHDATARGASMPFDATAWSHGEGPRRIAMARDLEHRRRLVGQSRAAAEGMLGRLEPFGDPVPRREGWRLGAPAGSDSLYPNEMWLAVTCDAAGRIVDARVVEDE